MKTLTPFTKELETHLPVLRRRALHLTRRPHEAEDLLQDTMLRALRFQDSFTAGTNLRAWLCQVMFSVFISQVRRRTRERKALYLVASDPNLSPQCTSAPQLHHLPPRVAGAMSNLSLPFQSVVRLIDLDEYSYQEAADALKIPIGTVMSRLHRGRKLLLGKLSVPELATAA